jgi:delta-aminolevulinic acid dehydratase/porphobilinogen synthase
MPGEVQHSLDSLVLQAKSLVSLGVPGLILFGVPARKDAQGSGAWDPQGVVQVALRALRDAVGDELVLMADLCLDEYTDHGHCGILGPSGEVLNDPTLELYQRIALAQAEAGADVVAPSGMMDGQVAASRARRRRPRSGCHPGLRIQVRVRALRPLPGRGRGLHRWRRRPPGLSTGPAQRARGIGRN